MASFINLSPESRNELWATLALRHGRGIGTLKGKQLVDAFGSAYSAVEACLASPDRWDETGIVTRQSARKFNSGSWREAAKVEWDAIRTTATEFVLLSDPKYPELLRQTDDAPLLLYFRGNLSLLKGPCVGVVGSRDCTREGIAVSAYFSQGLSRAGIVTVSGMARGIDRAAHIGGLSGVGSSIAVLGTGVDTPYPACNIDLYHKLAEHGLVVSEVPPGAKVTAGSFPVRNRIISGLSHGILVVEAAARSGSLITARLSLEQGRDVFAVPGHTLSALSAGCRDLVRKGAKAVFDADDILEELSPLLAREVRESLNARKAEAFAKDRKSAKDLFHDVDSFESAMELLPKGTIPWVAPGTNKEVFGSDSANAAGAGAGTVSGDATGGGTLGKQLIDPFDTGRQPNQKGDAQQLNTSTSLFPDELEVDISCLSESTEEEQSIIRAICSGVKHIDELARALEREVASLSAVLLMLEVRGIVIKEAGMFYRVPEAFCRALS